MVTFVLLITLFALLMAVCAACEFARRTIAPDNAAITSPILSACWFCPGPCCEACEGSLARVP